MKKPKNTKAYLIVLMILGAIYTIYDYTKPTDKKAATRIIISPTIHTRNTTQNNVKNFANGKKNLYKIYEKLAPRYLKTFYCDCAFKIYPKKSFDIKSCGIIITKYKNATGIDAEHIMPISLFGKTLKCWKNGGRRNCRRKSRIFQKAEGDLHNLVPSIPMINRLRHDYPPVEDISGEVREFGACDVEIKGKKFEPPIGKRGDIARAYLYMRKVYNVPLTQSELRMFIRWHQDDPPNDDEIKIHDVKAKMQGNINPFFRWQNQSR